MHAQHPHKTQGVRRRDLLQAGLAAGVTLSAWPLARPAVLWGAEAGQPKRGGILRVWGSDPPHFDPHLILNAKTHNALSFTHSTLVRHKIGPEVRPGTFIVEPHLADPDGFYEALIDMHRALDDDESQRANAALILLLANHIGDAAVLREAIEAALSGIAKSQGRA